MDSLTFISKAIESLAWPIAATYIAWLLRKEIQSLLPFIKRLKAGPVEAEFDQELRSLRVGTKAREPERQEESASKAQTDPLLDLAARNPRSAILEAWRTVEIALLKLANSHALLPPGLDNIPSRHVIEQISREHLIPVEEIALYYELRNLRNKAAHAVDFEPSQASALDYIELVKGFINVANAAKS